MPAVAQTRDKRPRGGLDTASSVAVLQDPTHAHGVTSTNLARQRKRRQFAIVANTIGTIPPLLIRTKGTLDASRNACTRPGRVLRHECRAVR